MSKCTAGAPKKGTPVSQLVREKAAKLSSGYLADAAPSRASVARLARLAGKPLEEAGAALGESISFLDTGNSTGYVGPLEKAVHTTLTLHAHHQRGMRSSAQDGGTRLGEALAKLHNSVEGQAGVERRVHRLLAAEDVDDAATTLRGLITMMRTSGIGLDYGSLYSDLYALEREDSAASARLGWGRDFYQNKTYTD